MNYYKKNSSLALSLAAVGGLVTTIIFAIKETPKAIRDMDDFKSEAVYPPTAYEKAMIMVPAYKKTIISGAATAFCILFSNHISRKQTAGMFAAALASSQMLEKLKASLTKEELDEAESRMAQDDYDEQKPEKQEPFEEKELFYEAFADKFFWSTDKDVISAAYHFNRNFALGGTRCVNEWLEFLGLKPEERFKMYGFNSTEFLEGGLMPWIDFIEREKTLKDGTKYKEISFQWDPIFDFENYDRDHEGGRDLTEYSFQNK